MVGQETRAYGRTGPTETAACTVARSSPQKLPDQTGPVSTGGHVLGQLIQSGSTTAAVRKIAGRRGLHRRTVSMMSASLRQTNGNCHADFADAFRACSSMCFRVSERCWNTLARVLGRWWPTKIAVARASRPRSRTWVAQFWRRVYGLCFGASRIAIRLRCFNRASQSTFFSDSAATSPLLLRVFWKLAASVRTSSGSSVRMIHTEQTRPRLTEIRNLLHLAPDIQEQVLSLPEMVGGRDAVFERDLRPIAKVVKWKSQRKMWRASQMAAHALRSP